MMQINLGNVQKYEDTTVFEEAGEDAEHKPSTRNDQGSLVDESE